MTPTAQPAAAAKPQGYTVGQFYAHAILVETDDKGRPTKVGKHIPNYECDTCQFSSINEATIQEHVATGYHPYEKPKVIKGGS